MLTSKAFLCMNEEAMAQTRAEVAPGHTPLKSWVGVFTAPTLSPALPTQLLPVTMGPIYLSISHLVCLSIITSKIIRLGVSLGQRVQRWVTHFPEVVSGHEKTRLIPLLENQTLLR